MLRFEKAENLIYSFCTGGLTDSEMELYKRVSKIALVKLKVAFLLIYVFSSCFIHKKVFFLWDVQSYYFLIQSMTQAINISNHHNVPAWLKASWISWIICMEIIANDNFNKEAWKPSINSCSIPLIMMFN